MFRLIVSESLTGRPVLEVTHLVQSGTWERKLNGFGSGRFAIALRGSGLTRAQSRLVFSPWVHQLQLLWDEQCIASGWILGAGWDRRTGALTVRHAEFRAIFQHRLMFTIGNYASGSREVYDLDAASVARWYIAKVFVEQDDPRARLPIEGGFYDSGTIRRTLFNYQAKTLESALQEVQDFEDGPDLDFRPLRRADGTFFHESRFGRPRLDAPTYDLHPAAPGSDAEFTDSDLDASKQGTGVLVIAEGSEFKQKVGQANELAVLDPKMPYLDRVETFKTMHEQEQIDGTARAIREAFKHPTESWGIRLRTEGYPGVAALTPGVRLRALDPGDEWELPGWRSGYVTGYSGSWGDDITVTMQGVA